MASLRHHWVLFAGLPVVGLAGCGLVVRKARCVLLTVSCCSISPRRRARVRLAPEHARLVTSLRDSVTGTCFAVRGWEDVQSLVRRALVGALPGVCASFCIRTSL